MGKCSKTFKKKSSKKSSKKKFKKKFKKKVQKKVQISEKTLTAVLLRHIFQIEHRNLEHVLIQKGTK